TTEEEYAHIVTAIAISPIVVSARTQIGISLGSHPVWNYKGSMAASIVVCFGFFLTIEKMHGRGFGKIVSLEKPSIGRFLNSAPSSGPPIEHSMSCDYVWNACLRRFTGGKRPRHVPQAMDMNKVGFGDSLAIFGLD